MTIANSGQAPTRAPLKRGPRSAEGKFRVSRNSTIHGLSVPLRLTDEDEAKISDLARMICNGDDRPDVVDAASRVAYAQFEVERVRRAKIEHSFIRIGASSRRPKSTPEFETGKSYAEAMTSTDFATLEKSRHKQLFGCSLPNKLVKTMARCQRKHEAARIDGLDRYEKRAWSARRTAIRAFNELLLVPQS